MGIEENRDEVQKLIDMGRERGFLLFDEMSDLLRSEVTSATKNFEDLLTTFGTVGIEVIGLEDLPPSSPWQKCRSVIRSS